MTACNPFIIKHVVKNISNFNKEEWDYSQNEEHSGIDWKIGITEKNGFVAINLICNHSTNDDKWTIQTVDDEFKIISISGKSCTKKVNQCFNEKSKSNGFDDFIAWEEMIKNYVIEDNLVVEIHVNQMIISGIEKRNLKVFDESMKEFSDVVLIVEDQKFYVSKLYLASQSTYFEAFFLRNFEESKKSEVTLNDINAKDFQNFLELLHGESPIDDSTIEGIVRLADMYDAKMAVRKCEQFLMDNSGKTLKEKLRMAHQYHLENLKMKCLSNIQSAAEIRSVLTYDLSKMDPTVVGALLQKTLALFK
ncbi:hypothetical protein GCK72_007377 [Caenorhabditis remanei]|uniref:BTB domain-containing protein n=1 Tax=Caenorhabditis remanei TaxID=31234 RepID=A0A6A5HHT8_CAERE|nr:hypothetical protein GCK72_007377 [Caenorhabditis remanei]KAF1767418.1 hypothetical protein GCK72_007377 [Caenorhabditis remanei]